MVSDAIIKMPRNNVEKLKDEVSSYFPSYDVSSRLIHEKIDLNALHLSY